MNRILQAFRALPVPVLLLAGCAGDSAMSVENRSPAVSVLAPANGATVTEGQMVTLSASAVDPEDGDLGSSVAWTSSRDGSLGNGPSVSRTLSVGSHTVTATVHDSDGAQASASVGVTVAADGPPTVSVSAPADGTSLNAGAALTLAATATDAEDGDLSESIAWVSDLDGSWGSGSSIAVVPSVGTHRVTASVSDSRGQSAAAAVNVIVTPSNEPPVVSIDQPSDGTTVPVGTTITFSATAHDPEDGTLNFVKWWSSIDGDLGRRTSFQVVLSPGTHAVVASVTDGNGLSAADTVTVTVGAAGTASIGGVVTDASSGLPLVGAQVFIASLSTGTLTNAQGAYSLVDVAPGMHTVDVQYIGYAAVSPRVTVTAGQTVTLDVQLGAPALEVCVGGSNAPTPSFTPFTTGPVLSNAAEAIAAIDTHYPAGLRAQGIGGTVRYWFFITSTGQVQAIRLDQSSGIRTLDGAGCEVAKVMKYSAALNVGVPVDVWVSVPITFQP